MMNPALPDALEPYRLADREAELAGKFPGAKLLRVREVAKPLGDVSVQARFGRNEDGERTVTGRVDVTLEVTCERCLEPMELPVDAAFSLVLVPEPTQLQSVAKDAEPWLVAPGEEVPIADLVEDTVLLALPPFPMHDAVECRIQTEFTPPEDTSDDAPEAEVDNPFSILARMKPDRSKQE